MKLTYQVGDKVVHPVYGAGIVIGITRKSIAGDVRRYYVVDPMSYDMQVMVPVDKAKASGLRDVLKRSGIARVFRTLQDAPEELSDDHKERQALVDEKLVSANPIEIAKIIRDLSWLARRKGRLGTTDTKLLDRARSLLAGELAIALDVDVETALERIQRALNPEEEEN